MPGDQFLGWVNIGDVGAGAHPGARNAIDLGPIARRLGDDGLPVAYSSAPTSSTRGSDSTCVVCR